MGFGVANQGRNVVVCEEGVGKDFGKGETSGDARSMGWMLEDQDEMRRGKRYQDFVEVTYGRLSMLSHDVEICSKCARRSDMVQELRRATCGMFVLITVRRLYGCSDVRPSGRSNYLVYLFLLWRRLLLGWRDQTE